MKNYHLISKASCKVFFFTLMLFLNFSCRTKKDPQEINPPISHKIDAVESNTTKEKMGVFAL